MKIEQSPRPARDGGREGRGQSGATALPSAGADAHVGSDTVRISEEARRRVENLERGPAAMDPDERADLVAELKRRVLSGNYRPDLRRTALFLIDDADHLV